MRRIQERAAALHIELIPLQQTIGHLEYMLKLPRYHHLREMREFPETPLPYSFGPTGFKHYNHIDEICASSDEACSVVETLLDEVMAAHPASRYVHLGCDEAWNLLSCPDCLAGMGRTARTACIWATSTAWPPALWPRGKPPSSGTICSAASPTRSSSCWTSGWWS